MTVLIAWLNLMRLRHVIITACTAVLVATTALSAPPSATAAPGDKGPKAATPTLIQRATLSADYQAEGPPSGADASPGNGRTGPFPGQVIPGFSAMIDSGDGTFWAMPDNGFGAKDNSSDFLLRLYHVHPQWEQARRGAGEIEIKDFISLRDPDRRLGFTIINEDTDDRLLTGSDFDIESVVRMADGSFWIGEEFGPFLLHVDETGKVISEPVGFRDGKSPQNPYLGEGEEPVVPSSRGFEAMAASPDGTKLYPIIEGSLTTDPTKRRRHIYEFDTRSESYTERSWAYETDQDANVIGDAFTVSEDQLLLVERDDFEGPAAVTKRIYRINLQETDEAGYVAKELVVDLLKIANPRGIGTESSADAYGVGDEFAFPFQSVETVVQLRNGRLLIANDNNYPGNAARHPGTPDDTEMIVIDLHRRNGPQANSHTVVGHRGASGYRPEHTLAAYELAINQCADIIEPDVVSTKDGVLVDRHESEIGGTTDVADHPEFADLKTTKTIDGSKITGWFTEDFTLAQLKTLRTTERIPDVRPDNTAFDGLYTIPTLDEVIDLARNSRTCSGAPVGVAPETKHPTYFDSIGLSMEEPLVDVLEDNGYGDPDSPVVIQSFETGNLRDLNEMTDLPLAQLVNCSGAPYDLRADGDPRTYKDLVTPDGLADIADYADTLGACKDVMIPKDDEGALLDPAPVIGDAHDAGLEVVGWTFRAENRYLPTQYRSGANPNAHGDLAGEIRAFLDAGMDGLFTDQPDLGVAALQD